MRGACGNCTCLRSGGSTPSLWLNLKAAVCVALGHNRMTNIMKVATINGFYAGCFASALGESLALFIFRDGVLAGADGGGFQYDSTISETSEGDFYVEATVNVPPHAASIIGITAGPEGLSYRSSFRLSASFLHQPFIRIETPHKPMNMRLVKLWFLEQRETCDRKRK